MDMTRRLGSWPLTVQYLELWVVGRLASVSCRHASFRTRIAAFSFYSVIQAYVVNATRQSYINLL